MHGERKDWRHGKTELLEVADMQDREDREGGEAGARQAQAEDQEAGQQDQAAYQGSHSRAAPQVGPLALSELLGRAAAQVQCQGDLEAQGPSRWQEVHDLQECRLQAGTDALIHVPAVPAAQGS